MFSRLSNYITTHYISRFWVLFIDVLSSSLSSIAIYWTINFLTSNKIDLKYYLYIGVFSAIVSTILSLLFKTHYGIIRHTTMREMWRILNTSFLKGITMFFAIYLSSIDEQMHYIPLKILVAELADVVLTLFVLLIIRVLLSNLYILIIKNIKVEDTHRTLIYGDDNEAVSTLGMIDNSNGNIYQCIGFITFANSKSKKRLCGFPVFEVSNERIFQKVTVLSNIDSIIFPSFDSLRNEKDRIVEYCTRRKINVLIKPRLNNVIDSSNMLLPIREIKIEDLLGRDEVEINMGSIKSFLNNKIILVTGAAGSIGGELCRQLTALNFKKLIMLDVAETPLHNMQLEFNKFYNGLPIEFIIADVRSSKKMESVFANYKPNVVFHAAAYKHVPLMESFPCESIGVNVFGTKNIADLSVKYQVEKFVMISTDKAVNPANVMGASKRIAEIYVQSLGKHISENSNYKETTTKFITTRFGNVLGSNGSVIPYFRDQIASGGPVTVTDPEIVRYFMTIPEATKLVMEAATMGKGDEIFVFDMGKPVKILDLAKKMIHLAGLEIDKDIQIKIIGLRPGEKLYEELLNNGENTIETLHKKIFLAKVKGCRFGDIVGLLEELKIASDSNDSEKTVSVMKKIVPEFISCNSKYEKLDKQYD